MIMTTDSSRRSEVPAVTIAIWIGYEQPFCAISIRVAASVEPQGSWHGRNYSCLVAYAALARGKMPCAQACAPSKLEYLLEDAVNSRFVLRKNA